MCIAKEPIDEVQDAEREWIDRTFRADEQLARENAHRPLWRLLCCAHRWSPSDQRKLGAVERIYAGTSLDCALMETVFHDVPFARRPKNWSQPGIPVFTGSGGL